jgi:hypothetical protein
MSGRDVLQRSNPEDLASTVLPELPDFGDRSLAVLLYGSRARGNPRIDSDTDILQLVNDLPLAYSIGSMNVTEYRPRTIRAMARAGSLFVLHLKTEGVILRDPAGVLGQCLDEYVPPINYSQMLEDVALAGKAVDPATLSEGTIEGTCRLAIYLLRTSLYIHAIEQGINSFDIDSILHLIGNTKLRDTMQLRHLRSKQWRLTHLALLHAQLSVQCGLRLNNEYGSLEGLAIAASGNERVAPLLQNLLMRHAGVDYSALSFPPF